MLFRSHQLTQQISEDFPKLGTDLQAMGFPADSIETARVVESLSSMLLGQKYFLVLDDYQHSESEATNNLLETLVKSQIYNLHLVVISRHSPKMNLTELVVKNLVLHIDTESFRFSREDTARYFVLMGLTLQEQDLMQVHVLAGGWVSALYLIYRGLTSGIPLHNITEIQDLLQTAIFERYNEATKDALCALASLEAFTPDLAAAATGLRNIGAIIKRLHRENAFVELDKASGVFRIHNVFRRFLQEEAVLCSVNTRVICSLAGKWYLGKLDYTQAFRYLVQGEAYETLLEVLERPDLYVSANDRPMLLRYFDAIPSQQRERRPLAQLKFIMLFVISGDRKRGAMLLKQFEEKYIQVEDNELDREVRVAINLIKMFMSFNDLDCMLGYIEDALELLDGGVSVIASHQGPFSFGSPHLSFLYYREAGAYRRTVELSLEKYAQLSGGAGMGSDALCLAEYALETGDFAAVEGLAFKAIYRAKTKNQTSLVVCAVLTLARLYLAQNKYSEARSLLESLRSDVADNIETILLDTYDLCLGYFYACTGETEKIPSWIKEGDMSVGSLLFQGLVFSYVVYGKILILQGDWVKAQALCESFRPYLDVFHNQLGYIHNSIHLAIAAHKQGDEGKALLHLNYALRIGQADRVVMPFIENGSHLLPLLHKVAKTDSAASDYTRQLIELCSVYTSAFATHEVIDNPLSPREVDVLRLMARGLNRTEIASELYLSTGTVRSHIQNIYQKLDVNKKSVALQKAVELNILT